MPIDRPTQKERLKHLFTTNPNAWIPLPTILELYIAQFGARIKELKADGMTIVNRMETIEGARHSFYKFIPQNGNVRKDLFNENSPSVCHEN